jgi:hypothetical protein
MLVEDILFGAVILFFVGGIIAPLAKGRQIFWRRKTDALEAARIRKEEADRKLEVLKIEQEAVKAETKYEREVNEMYLEAEKEKQRGN